MTEPLPDVWVHRDYPVLREVTRRLDAGESNVLVQDVAPALHMDVGEVARAGRALSRRGLVETMGAAEVEVLAFQDVSGQAYLLTGLHPDGDDAVTQLVSALRQAADRTRDPDEKSRLRALADGVGGVSRDILSGVLTTVITAAGRGLIS